MKYFVGIILAVSLTSCATLKQGQYQNIQFDSDPSGAEVWVDTLPVGETPVIACLKRGEPHRVVMKMDGYKTYSTMLNPQLSGWVLGNLIFGGPIGIGVDAVTGSMYKLKPNSLMACLTEDYSEIAKGQPQEEQVIAIAEG